MTGLTQTYRITVTKAWWWRWLYVPGVVTLAAFGMTPDWDKIERTARLAVRVRLVLVDNRTVEL